MERVTLPSLPSRPALAANWAAKAPTNELLVPPRPCACVSQWFSSRYTVAAAIASGAPQVFPHAPKMLTCLRFCIGQEGPCSGSIGSCA
ncbi:Uncharacterised protein [Mycobacteroides abscessus subsp. abscessus]|nr:Uncharacterised protein [Mycobacteroides abscessus subsp. abscessus]